MNRPEVTENKRNSQQSLAPAPLPSIEESVELFTQWFTPFLDNEQRAEARTALNILARPKGLISKLHKELQSYHTKKTNRNWLDRFWSQRFLARRIPTAINDNFFFLLQMGESDRIKHASSLIAATLNYKLVLDQGRAPTIAKRNAPICERQINNLFATSRIPGDKQDHLQNAEDGSGNTHPASRHMVIFCRGNIHSLELISEDGTPHAYSDIERGLVEIVESSLDEQSDGRSLGHLSSLHRSDWARTRQSLRQASRKNADNLDLIETALFSLSLEDQVPAQIGDSCDELLMGNSENRWFDKSLQFVVFHNGYAGINVEHAALDRATVVDFLDYIIAIDPHNVDQYSGAVEQGLPKMIELHFDLPAVFQKKIAAAAASFAQQKTTRVTRSFQFSEFDAKLLIANKLIPDALIICALQIAQYRLNDKFAAICQNISMRHFDRGRVQNMWAMTSEMADFINLAFDEKSNNASRFLALEKAAKQHEKRILSCRDGQFPQQHLAELHNIYKRHPDRFQSDIFTRLAFGGISSQEIDKALSFFTSPGWTCMQKDAFNISFLASPSLLYQGYSPAEQQNTSIGCLLNDGVMNVYLCADRSKEAGLDEFIDNWQLALNELQNLIREITAPLEPDPEE